MSGQAQQKHPITLTLNRTLETNKEVNKMRGKQLLHLLNLYLKSNAETKKRMLLFENSLAGHVGLEDRFSLSDVMDVYIDLGLEGTTDVDMDTLNKIIEQYVEGIRERNKNAT
jgi:hypothetical protein